MKTPLETDRELADKLGGGRVFHYVDKAGIKQEKELTSEEFIQVMDTFQEPEAIND